MDRLDILDDDVAYRLNTYRNWGQFRLMIDPFPDDKGGYINNSTVPAYGTKSLFNNVHAVYYSNQLRLRNNMPLMDTSDVRESIRNESDCSIRALVANSSAGKMGRSVYNYSDFMYCTELGRMSNNYMVTLRRFAAPCGDNILFVNPNDSDETSVGGLQSHAPDIGRMVTWIGVSGNDMSNILKYDYSMPFMETKADIQDVEGAGDSSGTKGLGALLNATDKKYQSFMVKGMGGSKAFEYTGRVLGGDRTSVGRWWDKNSGKIAPPYDNASWRGFRDNNKAYGPVDVIKSTNVRGNDGLQFNQSITLNFDYEMKSYDGINTRAAFLDLLANILTVTYSTGTFWGGGYRMTSGSPQSNVFANLPLFKMAEKGQINNFSDLTDGFFKSLESIWDHLSQGQGIMGAIKTLGSSLFSMFTGAALNQLGRPTKVATQSLLSPAPTGMWHLTIGNPMHPIMVMGNMILEKTEIEHYGPLGLDDFPTGLRVTCTLKHGKPRDISLIENMYVLGHSRVYIPVGKYISEMYAVASDYKESEKKIYQEFMAKKNMGPAYSGSDMANLQQVQVTETEEIEDGIFKRLSNLYFGTADRGLIITGAQEVAYGSNPIDKKNKSGNTTSGGNGQNQQA